MNHNYPGNIRELENILEHALIICQSGTIEPDDLPDYLQNSTARQAVSPVEIFGKDDDFREREKVLQALQINNWHRDNTAHALGIERTTLWRKMKKYGLLTPIIPSPDGKTLQK
ncbi:MAG TPA: hypothetical protein HPQ03_17100 [Deltaproteobacteria bacterium]|nr:hypothetical protein [Deltaproteobacteria bacterium]